MKEWRIFILLVTIPFIIFGACSSQLDPTPPERSFAIWELLVDVSSFPSDWVAGAEGPSTPPKPPWGGYESIERIELFFYTDYGGAFERIHRFRSEEEAIQEFNRRLELDFAQNEYYTPWIIPPELSYPRLVADCFHFACSQDTGVPVCQFLGQYEEYVVRFGIHKSPDLIPYADIEKILQAIDERMAHYLGCNDD